MEHQSTQQEKELSKIKEEILKEIRPNSKQKTISWSSQAVTIFLLVILLASITQTIESVAVLNKIKSGVIKPASAASSNSGLPASLDNVPDMVGGC